MALKSIILESYKEVKNKIVPYDLQIEGYLLFKPKTNDFVVYKNAIEPTKPYFGVYNDEMCKIYKKVKQQQENIDFCKIEFADVFINEGIMADTTSKYYGEYSNNTFPKSINSCSCKYWLYDVKDKLSAFSNDIYILCKYFVEADNEFKYLVFEKEELYLV
jgi:hypothetical protein